MERPDATRKRQRKLYHACDQCTVAKARCEEVQAAGCSRCRRRSDTCSLAGLEVTRSLSPAVLASLSQQEIISNLTARVQALEQSVNKSTFGVMAAPRLPPSPMDMVIQLRQPDMDGFRKAICGEPSTTFYGERAFAVTKMDGYPDVVERGLMTGGQLDVAFSLFKQRFTLLFPMAPFLLASTSTPHHPFLRTAILSHVSEACPLNHYILVDESILFAMTGSLSEDAMLALFILSLAPLHASSSHHVPPTPLRLISLAYQFGQSMGLETRTRSRIRRGLDFSDEAALISALLWESVKQFYTVFILLYSRVDEYPTLRITDIPRPQEDHHLRMHSYLLAQAKFLTAIRTMADILPNLEVGDGPLFADDVFIAWKLVLNTEECLLNGNPEQSLTVRCLLFSMALRMIMVLTQRANDIHASPEYPNVPATAAEITLEAANALIRLFHSRSSSVIPASLMIAIVTAMAFLRRTVVLLQKLNVDPRLRVDLRSLELAERLVAGHEGLSGRVLRDMWGSLHEDKPEQPEIWDFDWSLLETFYQEMGNAS